MPKEWCFKTNKWKFFDEILIEQDLFEWKMGFGFDDQQQRSELTMSKNPFLLPPEFYKNLFAASAILQKPNQTHNECNKLFNAQNFPRNLLFSCGEDKEVNLNLTPWTSMRKSSRKNIQSTVS